MGKVDDLKNQAKTKGEELQKESEDKLSGVKGGVKQTTDEAQKKAGDLQEDVEKDTNPNK